MKQPIQPCQFCGIASEYLCDFIIGWKKDRSMHTCDASMCEICRKHMGNISGVFSIDHCPNHVGKQEAFINVVISDSDAEAIRRRNQIRIVN